MTMTAFENLMAKGMAAREASRRLARLPTEVKDRGLLRVADAIKLHEGYVLKANEADCWAAQANDMSSEMQDRLLLTPERLADMVQNVQVVASLPDPVGEVFDSHTLPTGLNVEKRRVPLGVIGTIYESRPNVTTDILALSLKSGNACILRGGKEAVRSNTALVKLARWAMEEAGVPEGALQFVDDPDRSLVDMMLGMKDYIDLLVPRGGAELVRYVVERASMPVVTGGIGVCHTYIDKSADQDKAVAISYNAKVQRPTVCNALDSLLIHSGIASHCLPRIARQWAKAGVEMRCDPRAFSILSPLDGLTLREANAEDWGKEFLSLVAAVKVVDSLDEALAHIERNGSGHSEAIVAEDHSAAMRFLDEVDAAVVYVNASTRFTDGTQFGLGAEVGISTQKFHARGPMGLRELTSYKWTVVGSGQIRA